MCKYEQRSNWNRRPLKKSQICYACLDAMVCVGIVEQIMKEKKLELGEVVKMDRQRIVGEKEEG
jgi:ribonuclease D